MILLYLKLFCYIYAIPKLSNALPNTDKKTPLEPLQLVVKKGRQKGRVPSRMFVVENDPKLRSIQRLQCGSL